MFLKGGACSRLLCEVSGSELSAPRVVQLWQRKKIVILVSLVMWWCLALADRRVILAL